MLIDNMTALIKMVAITALYVILTWFLWSRVKNKKISLFGKIIIGVIYGGCSILSTHYGVDYGSMLLNLRDVAPLAAGLFFHPVSGVIAGLIGGIDRYIVGTYFGIGSYTRIACSISTCLAGFVACFMNIKVFEGKKPSPAYGFFMGAVMEVFHMYVVFITHRDDMRMAFKVVSACSVAMIFFTGLALAIMAFLLQVDSGEYKKPEMKFIGEDISVSNTFQKMLFVVTAVVIIFNFVISFNIMTTSTTQNEKASIIDRADDVKQLYKLNHYYITLENSEYFEIINSKGKIINGKHSGTIIGSESFDLIMENVNGDFFETRIFEEKSLNKVDRLDSEMVLLTYSPNSEMYWFRNAQAYETALADVLLFTIIYVLTAFLEQKIVVKKIEQINESLDKITNGDLNEVVDVRSSAEFASLSDDINETVDALKGYIDAAEKRMEQELLLARTIQASSLPRNFVFPGRVDCFEIFASMNAAKEVGGDFYDFFFVSNNQLAFVMADVSGKGIPASLFMMKSKTAIRHHAEIGGTPGEILTKANEYLCDGNDAEMFVTAWIGIIDLETGIMSCANAGHEYPLLMRAGKEFEVVKDKHSMPLATIETLKAKEYEIVLSPGDKLFVYTDGIPEAINEEVEQYGTDRLVAAINEVKDKSFTEILPDILEDVFKFKGKADQFDDITMLGFEFKAYSEKI